MSAVLVTGGAGFIGSHLVEQLLQAGETVVCIDDFSTGSRENLWWAFTQPNFVLQERSVCDNDIIPELKKQYRDLDTVFHLAAIANVTYSIEHPQETMDVNYRATMALLAQAERYRLKSFVSAGSAAEYGGCSASGVVHEGDAKSVDQALSPYGQAKYLASTSVAASPIGLSLRFFNIYGQRQKYDSSYGAVVPNFVRAAAKNEVLPIYGDGNQTRDFMFVADAVEAYLLARSLNLRGIYNVGTGVAVSVNDLAAYLADILGKGLSLSFCPGRDGEIRHSVADVSAFRRDTGWSALTPIYDGLQSMLSSYRVVC